MTARYPYTVTVISTPKNASDIPSWDSEALLFIRVNWPTLALMYAMTAYALEEKFWIGTQQEIDTALTAIREQISEIPKTKEEICEEEPPEAWGANFRIVYDEGEGALLQETQDFGLIPDPWEFRVIDVDGEKIWQYRQQQ